MTATETTSIGKNFGNVEVSTISEHATGETVRHNYILYFKKLHDETEDEMKKFLSCVEFNVSMLRYRSNTLNKFTCNFYLLFFFYRFVVTKQSFSAKVTFYKFVTESN